MPWNPNDKKQSRRGVGNESERQSAKPVNFPFLFTGAGGEDIVKVEIHCHWFPEDSTSRGRGGEKPRHGSFCLSYFSGVTTPPLGFAPPTPVPHGSWHLVVPAFLFLFPLFRKLYNQFLLLNSSVRSNWNSVCFSWLGTEWSTAGMNSRLARA